MLSRDWPYYFPEIARPSPEVILGLDPKAGGSRLWPGINAPLRPRPNAAPSDTPWMPGSSPGMTA